MESLQVVNALAALAQDTRLAIFRALVAAGPAGLVVGDIATEVAAAPATLSFHLKELTHAGLIERRPQGRFICYAANFAHMQGVLAYLTENCCARGGSCRPRRKARAG